MASSLRSQIRQGIVEAKESGVELLVAVVQGATELVTSVLLNRARLFKDKSTRVIHSRCTPGLRHAWLPCSLAESVRGMAGWIYQSNCFIILFYHVAELQTTATESYHCTCTEACSVHAEGRSTSELRYPGMYFWLPCTR
jgi:hypothetical protein